MLNIALVGNPNCGKTALFNAFTGSRQRVANYPGVTVDKKYGYVTTPKNHTCKIIDLPGTYSLRSITPDEKITKDVISGVYKNEEPIDIILCILDATNLQNGLRLLLELKQIDTPIIAVLNMVDIAKRREHKYDIDKLQKLTNVDVIETVAIKSVGIQDVLKAIDKYIQTHPQSKTTIQKNHTPSVTNITPALSRKNHIEVASIINQIELNRGKVSNKSTQIDKFLLHPVWGMLFLLTFLFLLFQAVFEWAKIPKDLLQSGFDYLQALITTKLLPNTMLGSLLGDGIIAGVGAVIVFIPQILIISLFVILLEDSGYMSRAAFIMDKIMASSGLHGKAFIPILSSFACAIPGIMATRTIENKTDRIITILVAPLTTCSARMPIYTLLISAFIPAQKIWGLVNLQGLVMFSLFLVGILFVLIMAFIFRFILHRHSKEPCIMELPSYKIPSISNVLIELQKPLKSFLRRAGTIIVSIMIILWFLSTYPKAPINAILPAINYSFVAIIGKHLEWLFIPIGFNWQIIAALIPGMAAREVAVSALATIYAVAGSEDAISHNLGTLLHSTWSMGTALSLITWYVFAPQCISTLAVTKRETNSYKWPMIMFSYQMGLAYLMSFIVYTLCL